MLIKRITKTVFGGDNTKSNLSMNFPKEAFDRLGRNYIFDIYEDHIELTPMNNMRRLAKMEEEELAKK